jgi:hypothetical protein
MSRRGLKIGFVGLLVASAASATARADTNYWFGTLGRVNVSVWRFGYDEGAGEGGWRADHALAFAAWASSLRDALPPGIGVSISLEEPLEKDEVEVTLLRCRETDGRCTRPLSKKVLQASALGNRVDMDGPFARRVLKLVGRAVGRELPYHATVRRPPVYTIQLLATRSEQRALEFSQRIDEVYKHDEPYLFEENCGPCFNPPEAKRQQGELAGAPIHRVFVGNYESRRLAGQDLDALARLGIQGYIRPLGGDRH